MAQSDQINLRSGATRVEVDAGRGGAITAFYTHVETAADVQQRHWLKSADKKFPACFPVVPWCSRIRDGQFNFAGRHVHIHQHGADEKHPIHGHGWQTDWQCRNVSQTGAELHYQHAAGDWPWSYQVWQRFYLSERSLHIQMVVQNCSAGVMPVAAGWHPFFSSTPAMRVQAPVQAAWHMDSDGFPIMPTGRPMSAAGVVPSAADSAALLRRGVSTSELALDTAFSLMHKEQQEQQELQTCGVAANAHADVVMVWPEWQFQLRMRASNNLRQLVVWTPPGESFVCLEPLSGFVHADGFAALDPGQSYTCGIVFTIGSFAGE